MKKKYSEINQCSYCGVLESGDAGTPEGWFGVDDDGDKVCDDCSEALEAIQERARTKINRQKGAKKTNDMIKKKNPNHYREAAKKRWQKKSSS